MVDLDADTRVSFTPMSAKKMQQQIDAMGFGWFQLVTLVLCGGIMFSEGSEMLVMGSITTLLHDHWDLNAWVRGLLVSCVFVGFSVGNMLSGLIGDRYGRRKAVLLSYAFIGIFGMLTAYCTNALMMVSLRFIVGVGCGIGFPAVYSLIPECCPTKDRGAVCTLMIGFMPVGELFAALGVLLLDPYLNKGSEHCEIWGNEKDKPDDMLFANKHLHHYGSPAGSSGITPIGQAVDTTMGAPMTPIGQAADTTGALTESLHMHPPELHSIAPHVQSATAAHQFLSHGSSTLSSSSLDSFAASPFAVNAFRFKSPLAAAFMAIGTKITNTVFLPGQNAHNINEHMQGYNHLSSAHDLAGSSGTVHTSLAEIHSNVNHHAHRTGIWNVIINDNQCTWRSLCEFSALPAFFFFAFVYIFLEESPHFLLARGRDKDLRKVLDKMSSWNRVALSPELMNGIFGGAAPSRVSTLSAGGHSPGPKVSGVDQENEAGAGVISGENIINWKIIFQVMFRKNMYRSITIFLFLCHFTKDFSVFGLTYIFPKFFTELQVMAPATELIVVSLLAIPGVLIAFLVTKYEGIAHRTSMQIFGALMACASLGMMEWADDDIGGFCAYAVKFCALGFFVITVVYTSEVFPTPIRNSAIGVCTAVGRLGSISAPLVFELSSKYSKNSFDVFMSVAAELQIISFFWNLKVALFVACFGRLFLTRETKGKPLVTDLDEVLNSGDEDDELDANGKKRSAEGQHYAATASSREYAGESDDNNNVNAAINAALASNPDVYDEAREVAPGWDVDNNNDGEYDDNDDDDDDDVDGDDRLGGRRDGDTITNYDSPEDSEEYEAEMEVTVNNQKI